MQLVLKPSSDSLINMELWLPPADKWNGKFMGVGNGGFAGSIQGLTNEMPQALRLGYATAGTDTGHQEQGGAWAIGHPEKMIDFGYRATHEMTLKAKQIVKAFYDRSAQYSYFKGCSTGGRMALMEAQRYPDDYDGIIAGSLANRHIHMWTAGIERSIELSRHPGRRDHGGAGGARQQPGDEQVRHAQGRVPEQPARVQGGLLDAEVPGGQRRRLVPHRRAAEDRRDLLRRREELEGRADLLRPGARQSDRRAAADEPGARRRVRSRAHRLQRSERRLAEVRSRSRHEVPRREDRLRRCRESRPEQVQVERRQAAAHPRLGATPASRRKPRSGTTTRCSTRWARTRATGCACSWRPAWATAAAARA